jgi:hypothetical protein
MIMVAAAQGNAGGKVLVVDEPDDEDRSAANRGWMASSGVESWTREDLMADEKRRKAARRARRKGRAAG